MFARNLIVAALGLGLLSACGGGGGGSGGEPVPVTEPSQFRVGGMVSGLNGSIVLQLNNGETLTVASDGGFTFGQRLVSGASYQVAVASQPLGQECSITSGSGTIGSTDISLRVNCSYLPAHVSGTVAGLAGFLRLQLNTDSLTLTSNGSFTFPTPLMQGVAYQVFIAEQPAGQQCDLSNATGVIGSVASNVTVSCSNTYMLGLSYSGVQGDLVVQNNGAEMRTISSPTGVSSGTTYFWMGLRTGTAYEISIRTQPAGQQCTLTGGTGTIGTSDVVSAATIVCTNIVPTFTVGGSVTGLSGTLTLRNGVSDTITLTGNGAFAFGTSLPQGAPYQVTIVSKPAAQQCTVSAGNGTVTTEDITTVAVSCVNLTPHTLGGRLIGVTSPVVLRNRDDNPLTLASDGTFTFTTPLVVGTDYEITATSANTNQMCHVARGTGTMPDAAVGNVSVVCNSKRPTRFMYVANEGKINAGGISGASISQYAVGTDGALMPLTPATVTAGVRPIAITVHPSGQFVYVGSSNGTSGGTTFWQFNISASGALTPMSTPSVSTFNATGPMVIDPAGAYLYSSRGLDLLRYPINADGSLATPIVQTLLTNGSLRSLTFDRAGQHAYSGGEDERGDGVIYQFSVASDGSLTAMTPASVEIGLPFSLALFAEPFDRSMYTVDNVFSRIVQFQRSENATLARFNHEPTYSATVFPWDLQAEPFGRFAYVIAPVTISTFNIGETGLLTPAVPASVRATLPENFTAFALDFAGENVYVTGSDVDSDIYLVHQYRIGSDGALTKIVSGSVATGIRPTFIAVAP